MFGGVRTDRATSTSQSASCTAISAAEFPAPTTSTRCPEYAVGSRYSFECNNSPVNADGSRPHRGDRHVGVSGCDDNRAGRPLSGRGLQLPPAVDPVDAPDVDAELGSDVEPAGVVAQVADEVVAGDPPTVAARNAGMRQTREPADGVQPEPVVARLPTRTDARRAFQQCVRDSAAVQGRSHGEPGRSGPDHHDVGCHNLQQ